MGSENGKKCPAPFFAILEPKEILFRSGNLLAANIQNIDLEKLLSHQKTPNLVSIDRSLRDLFKKGFFVFLCAIDKARQLYPSENYPNLHFSVMDATKLPEEWTSKFDYVTTYDAIHDLAKPMDALREIYRVLKPGGVYSMVDVNASSNVSVNQRSNERWRHQILYTISLYHCMPISGDGAALGAMWGKEQARDILRDMGFVKMKFRPLNDVFGNYHCVCRKP